MNFTEMSGLKQWGLLLVIGAVITGGLHFTLFKSQQDQNEKAQAALDAKNHENAELESYKPKLADVERQIASLKQQLDIERRIVPDEKEVDGFIKMMDAEALKAGIEIRRYSALPVVQRDYFSEVPFDVELDGPYYSMLGFFDQVSKLERIVNVSGLQMATVKHPTDAKAKHSYQYAPNESVVVTCQATTFFSHDLDPAAAAPVKGKAAQAKRKGVKL